MEKSIMDLVVDELVERHRLVRTELHKRFKKTRPFRMEPMSKKEKLETYLKIDPEMEMQLRQSMGDEIVGDYMNKLRGEL